jgi:putative endopeptidase
MKSRFLLSAAAMAMLSLTAATSAPLHGIDKAAMDASVMPGNDFYGYANGTWMKTTVIPDDQARWGSFNILALQAQERLRGIIEDAAKTNSPAGSEARKIGDYYATLMDEAGRSAKGITPLKPELAAIDAIADKTALATALGKTLRADVDPLNNTNFYTQNLFGLWVAPGFTDSKHYNAYLLQGGTGMRSRDYYLDASPKMAAIRTAYRAHVAKLLTLAGMVDAQKRADAIIALETRIATAQVSMVDSQDTEKANNPWNMADFPVKAPGLDWKAYFAGAGLNAPSMIVWQPGAFAGLSKLVASEPLDAWKDWLAFHRINRSAATMGGAFEQENFDFNTRVLTGVPVQQPLWKRAVGSTDAVLGDAIGKIYAAKYFPPESKARLQGMVKNIITAFSHRIDALTWMAPATKAEAKKKLLSVYVGVGYTDKWRDYSGLEVVKGDAIGNQERAGLFEYHYQVDRLGKPTDKTEWHMTPQTVNAVNLPLQNALNFPAAILDRPFFDPKAADAFNYGAIGSVIGHEISHSFDNQGATFDAAGRLHKLWTKADFAHFQQSGKALAAQFDTYYPFPDLHVRGEQTMGENIADNAGLAASFDAWKASLKGKPAPLDQGLTGEKQFFLAYAQVWSSKMREAAERVTITTNEHAPGEYRALEVRNMDAWYAAFAVKPDQKQYLAPDQRVHVW